jgi:hypothetical protein
MAWTGESGRQICRLQDGERDADPRRPGGDGAGSPQARLSKNPVIIAEFTHLAKGYQVRAASLDNGKFPDIGEPAKNDEG